MKTINEAFICLNCGKKVLKADKTCRNHCPFCFVSRHVDGEEPGDRASICQSPMYPISYEMKNSEIRILFRCVKCGKQHRNKRAMDDQVEHLPGSIERYRQYFQE